MPSIDFDKFFAWLFAGALTLACVFVTVMLICSARVTGGVDFCWIETTAAPQYKLTGHRPWRSDIIVASVGSYSEALTAAQSAGCKLWAP